MPGQYKCTQSVVSIESQIGQLRSFGGASQFAAKQTFHRRWSSFNNNLPPTSKAADGLVGRQSGVSYQLRSVTRATDGPIFVTLNAPLLFAGTFNGFRSANFVAPDSTNNSSL